MANSNKMAAMVAKSKLQKILEESGEFTPFSHSGRGMYGDECLAVDVGDEQNGVGRLIAEVLCYLDNREEDTYELQKSFQKMRIDDLGRGQIVYFMNTAYGEREEDEESDDESVPESTGV